MLRNSYVFLSSYHESRVRWLFPPGCRKQNLGFRGFRVLGLRV